MAIQPILDIRRVGGTNRGGNIRISLAIPTTVNATIYLTTGSVEETCHNMPSTNLKEMVDMFQQMLARAERVSEVRDSIRSVKHLISDDPQPGQAAILDGLTQNLTNATEATDRAAQELGYFVFNEIVTGRLVFSEGPNSLGEAIH